LQAAEVRRSSARPTNDLTAYDLYLRALATFYPITKERLLEALELLEQAIAIDRHCGQALSLAAMCQMRLVRESWAETPETASRRAVDLARQALQAAGDDPGILANAAFVLANFGEEIVVSAPCPLPIKRLRLPKPTPKNGSSAMPASAPRGRRSTASLSSPKWFYAGCDGN
jgi:hypothetical protein